MTTPTTLSDPATVLSVSGLVKEFAVTRHEGRFRRTRGQVRAVDGVDFDLQAGETLGIVGESGCGKSTLARVLMGLEVSTAGTAELLGEPLFDAGPAAIRRARRRMQMVFQDPYSSLDPRMSAYRIIAEPWTIHDDVVPPRERRAKVADLMGRVGLDPSEMDRLASAFSGGQRQRIGIARALALSPKVLILDEPVSALDVSIQAQIVELLRELQDQFGLALIFIAHDLAVVRSLAHRVAVMYLGRIVEIGPSDVVYESPSHPYTKALLSAVPAIEAGVTSRIRLEGEVPSPLDPPSGCRFRTRCWKAQDRCAEETPLLEVMPTGQRVACFYPETAPA